MYAALHDTLLFAVFYLSLSKLYTNAVLASLNARPVMHRRQATFYITPYEGRKPPTASERTSHFIGDAVDSQAGSSQTSKVVTLHVVDIRSDNNGDNSVEQSESSEKVNHIWAFPLFLAREGAQCRKSLVNLS